VNASQDSFKTADRAIGALLDRFARRSVCPCCAGRALIYHGIALAADIYGTDLTVEMLTELVNEVRTTRVAGRREMAH
jgi:hypothetical protein